MRSGNPLSFRARFVLSSTNRRAVTLLELSIVLLILGLVAAVAAPRFSQSMRSVQGRAAAIQVAAHLDYARRTAIHQGRSTSLTFATDGSGYSSLDVNFPGRVEEKLHVSLHDMFDRSISASATFDSAVRNNAATIRFDLEGVPHVGSSPLVNGTIEVFSPGNRSQVIVIASGNGKLTVRNGSVADGSQSNEGN